MAAVGAVMADVVEALDLLINSQAVEKLVKGLDEPVKDELGVTTLPEGDGLVLELDRADPFEAYAIVADESRAVQVLELVGTAILEEEDGNIKECFG